MGYHCGFVADAYKIELWSLTYFCIPETVNILQIIIICCSYYFVNTNAFIHILLKSVECFKSDKGIHAGRQADW